MQALVKPPITSPFLVSSRLLISHVCFRFGPSNPPRPLAFLSRLPVPSRAQNDCKNHMNSLMRYWSKGDLFERAMRQLDTTGVIDGYLLPDSSEHRGPVGGARQRFAPAGGGGAGAGEEGDEGEGGGASTSEEGSASEGEAEDEAVPSTTPRLRGPEGRGERDVE